MAEFASNVPVSRPVHPGWSSDWDLGDLQFSHEHGVFYAPEDDYIPLRKPSPRTGN